MPIRAGAVSKRLFIVLGCLKGDRLIPTDVLEAELRDVRAKDDE